jgi:hypothetical protein
MTLRAPEMVNLKISKLGRHQPSPKLKRRVSRPDDVKGLRRQLVRLVLEGRQPPQSPEVPTTLHRMMRVKMFRRHAFERCTETRLFLT